ncbi:hypothetical protein SAMN05660236_5282 [Ohtaekwangia koreensis]|uniref:Uncharacterized protein n=1 Tax=Ohtaekwangia koreensis TaxID=688867 RepID=A0A1T5MF83_9BACT|nr:hypothetical protein SAMN05660236_5282 [Ohtaekwangia koreensis]
MEESACKYCVITLPYKRIYVLWVPNTQNNKYNFEKEIND